MRLAKQDSSLFSAPKPHASSIHSVSMHCRRTADHGNADCDRGFIHKTDGSLGDRYLSLVQHDSYWFANIIDRGYGTTIPPADHKAMEISNVAFFPGYPVLAGMVKRVTGLGTYPALLVTAQLATAGFWTYFFLFGARWGLPLSLQVFGALAIAAHPAAFFLVAGLFGVALSHVARRVHLLEHERGGARAGSRCCTGS